MSAETWTATFLGIIAFVSMIWTVAVVVILLQVLKNLKQLQTSLNDLQTKAMPALDKINANLTTVQSLLEQSKGPMDSAGKVMGNLVSVSEQVKDVTITVKRLASPAAIQVGGVLAGVLSALRWYITTKNKGTDNGKK